MVKIDLVTGFLGSGKTTFIKRYAKYLIDKGYNLCILENDFGAINVDMMFLDDLNCGKEMVSGACDYDCHLRRFKTKLIQIAMMGYDRVIVEPSGIYDTDEFFDCLYEEPLNKLYEISNIFCIYDIDTKDLSYESKYILTSESSVCGKLIISKRENNELVNLDYINSILKEFNCNRVFSYNDVMYTDNLDFNELINGGYKTYDYIKIPVNFDNNYDSIYFLDTDITINDILTKKDILFNNKDYGNIVRIKGFIYENNRWNKVNLTDKISEIEPIENGQKVIIIIGENLNKELINEQIKKL